MIQIRITQHLMTSCLGNKFDPRKKFARLVPTSSQEGVSGSRDIPAEVNTFEKKTLQVFGLLNITG